MATRYIDADALQAKINGISDYLDALSQLELVCDAIAEAQTVDVREVMASAWIPVSERLPSNGDIVICTEHYPQMDYVRIMYYRHGRFNTSPVIDAMCNEDMTDNITAWMPLPEPYRGDE